MNTLKLSNRLPDFSAVILDLDGLVLDSEVTYINAWKSAAEQQGLQLSEAFYRGLSGNHYAEVEQKLIENTAQKIDLEQFRHSSAQSWHADVQQNGIAVKSGLFKLIELLKLYAIPYAIATNSDTEAAWRCLTLAGIENLFSLVLGREQVRQGKPAPDIFFLAAQQLQVPIEQTMIVEDSHIGILAAQQTPAFAVLITASDVEATVELADLTLPSLSELAGAIREKFSSSAS